MGSDKITRFNRRLKKSKKDKNNIIPRLESVSARTMEKEMDKVKRRREDRQITRIRSFHEFLELDIDV
jgi:hypothetical protein